jgi:uncharacterized membrane protein YkoI
MSIVKEIKEIIKEIKETKTIYKAICDKCGGDFSHKFTSPCTWGGVERRFIMQGSSFMCDNCTKEKQDEETCEKFKWLIGSTIKDIEADYGSIAYITLVDKDGTERMICIGEDGGIGEM